MRKVLVFLVVFLASCGPQPQVEAQTTSVQSKTAPFAEANPIYVNQYGFSPESHKLAFYRGKLDAPIAWSLHEAGGKVILSGKTEAVGYSKTAEQYLNKIDFSEYKVLGEGYYLTVDGTKGPSFDIAKHLYKSLKYDALAYFYHARAGVPIETPYVNEEHARPAGHPTEVVTCFKGKDLWGTEWPGCDYKLDVTGGWYDAGDHGKYVVNAGISTWTLLNAYEQFGDGFADGKVNIPEAGNGVNDLLDEARYNIEWMLSMQVPQGTMMALPLGKQEAGKPLKLTKVDASGMVHHKVHDAHWTGNILPHEDKETRYFYPPSTGATLNLAAIGAQCARIWREIDVEFAERCRQASEASFLSLAGRQPIFAYNNFDGGGPYSDSDFIDEVSWAVTEDDLMRGHIRPPFLDVPGTRMGGPEFFAPSFNSTGALAAISRADMNVDYAFGENKESDLNNNPVIWLADKFLTETVKEKLHFPYYSEAYSWGSNSALANRAIVLGTAYKLTGEQKYRDGVVDLMDYLLGRNPTGYSHITGYGDKPFKNPHHRFWAKSEVPSRPEPPAGVLSGGPNNSNMSDPVAKTMKGKCAPQTCWVDDHGAWTMNEVTINWNAPLFWMAAFLDATEE